MTNDQIQAELAKIKHRRELCFSGIAQCNEKIDQHSRIIREEKIKRKGFADEANLLNTHMTRLEKKLT